MSRGPASMILVGMCLAFVVQANADDHPYDRAKIGCVQGDCISGNGAYLYEDDDVYEGGWRDGKPHGRGTYYIVDSEPWRAAHRITGTWKDGKQHGAFSYRYPNGVTASQYWYDGKDVTSQVDQCRSATTVTDAYKGFVAIVNGLAAAFSGGDIAEGAEWGYDAADKQTIPRIVDLTCEQLLQEFN